MAMTLNEFLERTGPDRKKGSGLILLKLLACGDQDELFKLKADFMVHFAELRKQYRTETDAVKKDQLWQQIVSLDYPNEVVEVAGAMRENLEHVVGYTPKRIAELYEEAQSAYQKLLQES